MAAFSTATSAHRRVPTRNSIGTCQHPFDLTCPVTHRAHPEHVGGIYVPLTNITRLRPAAKPATERQTGRRGAPHNCADVASGGKTHVPASRSTPARLHLAALESQSRATWRPDPGLIAHIDAERRQIERLKVTTRTIPLTYVEDPSLPSRFIAHVDRLENPFRRVATFTFNGVRVDVDQIGGRGYGPGFSFIDLRIFFGFELRGRAWQCGSSIGLGGRLGPAGILLRDDLALVVGDAHDCVYLRRLTDPLAAKTRWYASRKRRRRRP